MISHSIFEFRTSLPANEFTVVSFHGVEEVSKLFSFEILLAGKGVGIGTLDRDLLGQPAQLIMGGEGDAQRTIGGIVRRLEAEGLADAADGRHRFRAWLVPRLWLLGRKRNSRIFQDKTVREIIDRILDEWHVPRRWTLLSSYEPREYCVQHQETDLGFIRRLLAEEGIFFAFHETSDEKSAETVVFSDSVRSWTGIAGHPLLEMHDTGGMAVGGMSEREEDLRRFRVQDRVRPGSVHLKEFDFARPSIDLSARARVRVQEGAFDLTLGHVYDHHGEFERGLDTAEAERHLEQHRSLTKMGVGESRCRRLLVGRWFELQGCPVREHDGKYNLLRVEHRGRHPEITALAEQKRDVYENSFSCVPVGAPFRPRRPRRRIRQVMETALVVGPVGQEIHTDARGRIKVQFHWDLEGRRDERSSCWIRTTQTWAGTGWGFQFIPRIGMEVLVLFAGGDVDRPIVIGSAYNGEHPTPYQLPIHKTRSGIRTQTTPGNGYNELSFEDQAGEEQISIHAQKDLEVKVLNDQSTTVGANRNEEIGGHLLARIGGNSLTRVTGDHARRVAGDDSLEVGGGRSSTVRGDLTELIDGRAERRVAGDQTTRIQGHERRAVDGATEISCGDEVTVRVGGSVATVIGSHDARRSHLLHVEGVSQLWSTGTTRIASESEVLIECGKSSIRLGPDRIELHAPSIIIAGAGGGASFGDGEAKLDARHRTVVTSAATVQVSSPGAAMIVGSEVKIAGPMAHTEQPGPVLEAMKPAVKPTRIELVDEQGNPLPFQRYRITRMDGSVLGGVSDADGKASVALEETAFIEFPALSEVERV